MIVKHDPFCLRPYANLSPSKPLPWSRRKCQVSSQDLVSHNLGCPRKCHFYGLNGNPHETPKRSKKLWNWMAENQQEPMSLDLQLSSRITCERKPQGPRLEMHIQLGSNQKTKTLLLALCQPAPSLHLWAMSTFGRWFLGASARLRRVAFRPAIKPLTPREGSPGILPSRR